MTDKDNDSTQKSNANNISKFSRAALNAAAGAVPFVGGVLAAVSAAWSEREQDRVNEFLKYRQQLIEREISEQLQIIYEIMQRLDKIDQDVSERLKSLDFQSLVEKSFRNWSAINSQSKREYVRNILVNAASTDISSDDVIKLFIEWLCNYSDLHFQVIACVYQHSNGISRGEIWSSIGKQKVREDSAEADLYKLLIRDLTTGGIIRQYRKTDYHGNFMKSQQGSRGASNTMKSAFDTLERYVLTELGQQFVHYAMSDVSTKIEHQSDD